MLSSIKMWEDNFQSFQAYACIVTEAGSVVVV